VKKNPHEALIDISIGNDGFPLVLNLDGGPNGNVADGVHARRAA
jgi:hypothetical protein